MEKWLWLLIDVLLKNISGPMRAEIEKWVKELERKAKETATPADDLFVGILKWLLGMP